MTHRFAMSDIMKAYDTSGNAAKEDALKMVPKSERSLPMGPLKQLFRKATRRMQSTPWPVHPRT
jgi:hypothetical protein